jgi:vacuolar iron transporter family protein
LTAEESKPIVEALKTRPQAWADFMVRFQLGPEKPDPRRAVISAGTIAGAYIAGGFFPLCPYIFSRTAGSALTTSVIITLSAPVCFGYIKGRFTGTRPFRSAIQTLLIGGLAATAGFMIAWEIS